MNKFYFKAILEQKKGYWSFFRIFNNFREKVNLLGIKIARMIHGKPTSEKTSTAIFRMVSFGALASVGLILLCRSLNDWTNSLLEAHLNLSPENFSKDTYFSLISTMTGVMGVFLGIYFAVLSNIASGPYDSVDRLKDIFLREKTSNRYVKFLSFLTTFLILLLCDYYLEKRLLTTALILISCLAPLAIFAFIELGKYMFFLSNPAMFFGNLDKDFANIFKRITKHCRKNKKNLLTQRYCRAEAKDTLDILSSINEFFQKRDGENARSKQLLLEEKREVATRYIGIKNEIPTDSGWFEKTTKYEDWYDIDDYKLAVAMQSGTQIQPSYIVDEFWFEDAIINGLLVAIKEEKDVNIQSLKRIKNNVTVISQIIETLSYNWSTGYAIEVYQKLSNVVVELVQKKEAQFAEYEKLVLPIIELLSRIPIAVLLGFVNSVGNISADELLSYSYNSQKAGKHIYKINLPRQVLTEAEKLYEQVQFEKKIKSLTPTPCWFIAESIMHHLDIWSKESWDAIIEMATTTYTGLGEKTLSINPNYAAIIYERYNEMAHKISFHFNSLRAQIAVFERKQRIGFYDQANWDWGAESKKMQRIMEDAVSKQAEIVGPLSKMPPRRRSIPDFLGEAVTNIGKHCYRSLKQKQMPNFSNLFGYYFYGILSIYDRNLKGKKKTKIAGIPGMTRPLRELLIISGYAYIYSELNGDNKNWKICKKTWDKYLERTPNALSIIAAIIRLMQTDKSTIYGRTEIEFEWAKQLFDELEIIPKKMVRWEEKVEHESKLIQKLAASGHTGIFSPRFEPIEIFVAKYLSKANGAKDLEFGIDDETIRAINEKGDKSEK
ncbi:hypothetical protein IKF74_01015 [Candidatus Saccharibacteria bacterium]|nr:hypothetical protein [Candidatus Saccharibacteria bacterium]